MKLNNSAKAAALSISGKDIDFLARSLGVYDHPWKRPSFAKPTSAALFDVGFDEASGKICLIIGPKHPGRIILRIGGKPLIAHERALFLGWILEWAIKGIGCAPLQEGGAA